MSSEDTRSFWDEQAATFDDAPDHGLTDPVTRHAWATLLDAFLKDSNCAVVDLGCGTEGPSRKRPMAPWCPDTFCGQCLKWWRVVGRWSAPLSGDGVFVAIEGVWDRAGIAPAEVFSALENHFEQVEYIDLTNETALWGQEVTDHRYAVVGSRPRGGRHAPSMDG